MNIISDANGKRVFDPLPAVIQKASVLGFAVMNPFGRIGSHRERQKRVVRR